MTDRIVAAVLGIFYGALKGFSMTYSFGYNIAYWSFNGGVFPSMISGCLWGLILGIPASVAGAIVGLLHGFLTGKADFS